MNPGSARQTIQLLGRRTGRLSVGSLDNSTGFAANKR